MKTVAGKRVLITGGAMGMGRLYAERAVTEGAAEVVLWDINADALSETADALTEAAAARGAEAGETAVTTTVVDLSDRDAIVAAADALLSTTGAPHILFNNAGVVRGNAYFWESDAVKDAEFTMAVNALAPMYVARAFLPSMIESGEECRLVNMASAAGLTSNPRMAAYAASKWAAVGFSDSLRLELEQAGHKHVKVTTVCPYYVKTGMFEGARASLLIPLLEPEEVVAEAWKAMLKGSSMVILPKTVLLSEIAKGIIPTPLRDFLAGKVLGVYHSMDDFTGRS